MVESFTQLLYNCCTGPYSAGYNPSCQRARPLRQSPEPLLMHFTPLGRATVVAHRECSSRGFCISGRCFVVVNARIADAPDLQARELARTVCSGRQGPGGHPPLAGISTSRHHKAPSSSGRALTQQMGECRRRTRTKRCAVLTSPARELSGGIAGTELQGDVGLALRKKGALEITKPDAQRAVVLPRMAEWGTSPDGLVLWLETEVKGELMKLLFRSDVYGWRMTGLLGARGEWFLGFSTKPVAGGWRPTAEQIARAGEKALREMSERGELPVTRYSCDACDACDGATVKPPAPAPTARQAFEADISTRHVWNSANGQKGWLERTDSGRYRYLHIDAAWESWQAALCSRVASPPQDDEGFYEREFYAITEAMGYPPEKDYLATPAEYAADLKRAREVPECEHLRSTWKGKAGDPIVCDACGAVVSRPTSDAGAALTAEDARDLCAYMGNIERTMQALRWIPVSERLPEVVREADGSVNSVLVMFELGREPNGGSRYQVCNTVWVSKWSHTGEFSHWATIEPPAGAAEGMAVSEQPIETAPTDREILVFNAMYGWYRSRRIERDGQSLYPLYGLLGRGGGVWYPVPSHWTELPPVPQGMDCMRAWTTDTAEWDLDTKGKT